MGNFDHCDKQSLAYAEGDIEQGVKMSARVRATCTKCGDIELPVRQVEVRVCREDNDGVYRFECPKCEKLHEKSAARRTLDLLIASGSRVIYWSVPVEQIIEEDLGPLTHSHLLDFNRDLTDEDKFSQALGELLKEAERDQ